MRKLTVFDMISLDGYFCDAQGDMSWAHRHDPEWDAYMSENASTDSALLFGRITYEQMAGFWPTEMGRKTAPVVAERMTAAPKIVFSRTLQKPTWNNTSVEKGDLTKVVARLKKEDGPDMALMGSGSIVAQIVAAGLIDDLTLVMSPIVLGAGRSLFEGANGRARFRPVSTRTFENGNVVLSYAPA